MVRLPALCSRTSRDQVIWCLPKSSADLGYYPATGALEPWPRLSHSAKEGRIQEVGHRKHASSEGTLFIDRGGSLRPVLSCGDPAWGLQNRPLSKIQGQAWASRDHPNSADSPKVQANCNPQRADRAMPCPWHVIPLPHPESSWGVENELRRSQWIRSELQHCLVEQLISICLHEAPHHHHTHTHTGTYMHINT